ncbi:MAG: radical SAM protein [Candidatus Baldrarchaeia archaeon]
MFRDGYAVEAGRYIYDPRIGMVVATQPIIFRPPVEATSLILQPTVGCPWNRCRFCGTYKRQKFRIRVKEVLEDIKIAKRYYGDRPTRVFLADGNPIILKTEDLLRIVEECFKTFPHLTRVSCYGAAKYIIKKGEDELKALCDAGLKKIYMGLETGDDELLKKMHKGATVADMIKAAKMVKDAGMELSVTIIQGLGGAGSWKRNAELTAKALNEMKPDEVRLHALFPHPDAPLYQDIISGEFKMASWREIVMEVRELIKNLNIRARLYVHGTHYIKPGAIDGYLPEDKGYMLETLDFILNSPDGYIFLQEYRSI